MMAALEPIAVTSFDVKALRDFIASSEQGIHGA
jgi:hypothetical protein